MNTRIPLEPLAQQSTAIIIADRLREAIGRGDLPAGVQLYEAQLAREFGVSRGPFREGIQRLIQEGLLLAVRNRGVFVIEMTPENVRDMYVARTAVERAAATQVFVHDPVQAGEQLLQVVTRMASAAACKRVAEVSTADIEFHIVLVAHAHSPRLSRMHQTLITETRMCIHALEPSYQISDDRVEEHRAIARAFVAGKASLVDRLLVAHMEDALTRLGGEAAAL